eukprot:342975_1
MSNSNNNKQPSINITGGQMYGVQSIGGGKQQKTFNLQKQRNIHQSHPEEKKEVSYHDNITSSSASSKIQNIKLLQRMGFEINQCLLSLIDEYNDIDALLDAIELNRSGSNAINPTTNLQPIAILPPSSANGNTITTPTTSPYTTSTSTTTETVSTDGLNSSNSNPNSNNNNNMNTIMVNQYVVGTISNAPS